MLLLLANSLGLADAASLDFTPGPPTTAAPTHLPAHFRRASRPTSRPARSRAPPLATYA